MRRTFFVTAYVVHLALSASVARAAVYNMPPDALPATLSAGDTLNFHQGGVFPDDKYLEAFAGSTINVHSGSMGLLTYLSGDLNIYGGKASSTTVADGATIDVFAGSTGNLYMTNTLLNVYDGQIGGLVDVVDSTINMSTGDFIFLRLADSTINMAGGKLILGMPNAGFRTTVNVSGGELGELTLRDGSVANLRGGALIPNRRFLISPDATAHLFVRNASINGSPVPGLAPGVDVPIDVTNVNGLLMVTLQNGSPFTFRLSTTSTSSDPGLPGAIISTNPSNASPRPPLSKVEVLLTLVPEPPASALVVTAIAALVGSSNRLQRSTPRREVG